MKELEKKSETITRHYVELFDKTAYVEKNEFDKQVTFHFHVEKDGAVKYANFIYSMEKETYDEAFAKGFSENEMIHLVQIREKIITIAHEN